MIIGARYNGPPGTGNGGYTAGMVASFVDAGEGAVEVTLRRPPPMETELTVVRGDVLRVVDPEGRLVAEAAVSAVDHDEVVPGVSFAEAVDAASTYPGLVRHPFPTCFVCGPDRAEGDGLRLFPGRLSDGRTAAAFVVPRDVSEVLVWAALDCPGGWAVEQEDRPHVLGRLAVRVDGIPVPGDECLVMGQRVGQDGRKSSVLTTLYSPEGKVLAAGRATWVAL